MCFTHKKAVNNLDQIRHEENYNLIKTLWSSAKLAEVRRRHETPCRLRKKKKV